MVEKGDIQNRGGTVSANDNVRVCLASKKVNNWHEVKTFIGGKEIKNK